MEWRALLWVRVATGKRADVLRGALGLTGVDQVVPAGPRELLLLAACRDEASLGAAARAVAALQGVEAVACSAVHGTAPEPPELGAGNYL